MTGEKIIITGSCGMLGSSFKSFLSPKANVVGLNSTYDITDSDAIYKKLYLEKPNIIIHAAAYTNVDGCETHIDKAYKVNTIGVLNLINYCVDNNVLFVFMSSTGVYGEGSSEPYTEFDDVEPTTVHHKSKFEAEKIIRNHLSKYLILRTGWLYGGDKNHNKNFVYKRYLDAKNSEVVYSDNTQVGNPTSVIDLSAQLFLLINHHQYGTFNCVNRARNISRFDYVKKIVELYGLKCEVRVGDEDMFIRQAQVSKNESAVNYKLDLLGLNVMNDWEVSLAEYIKELKSEK